MESSQRPTVLNKIEVTKWVRGTAQKMEASGSEDRISWNENWLATYRKLGGRAETTGKKPCPMAAAYAIWYLGMLSGTSQPRRAWSAEQVNQELGKNAAYAVIAVELMNEGVLPIVSTLWPEVQTRYKEITGEEAALSEQGEIRLVAALRREKQLIPIPQVEPTNHSV